MRQMVTAVFLRKFFDFYELGFIESVGMMAVIGWQSEFSLLSTL